MSTPYYKLLDLVAILGSAIFAYWLRFDELQLSVEYVTPTAVFALSASISLTLFGFYGATNSAVPSRRFLAALSGLALSALITTTFMYLTKTGQTYSRLWFITSVLLSLGSILLARIILARLFLKSIGMRGIVIVGDNLTAKNAERTLLTKAARKQGLAFLHRFGAEPSTDIQLSIEEAVKFIQQQPIGEARTVSEVWVTSDVFNNQAVAEIELLMSDISAAIVYIPEMPPVSQFDISRLDSVMGIPTLNSNHRKTRKLNIVLKYCEDKLAAILLSVILGPIMLVIALAIKLDSRGPVFYTQSRHGFGGREFRIYKFRTMLNDQNDKAFRQATADDPRITQVGKWLRRTSLDELPQLINVLNGSMSIVGPRPHPVELNQDFRHKIDRYMVRHSVKPGITGLAQINGFRGETSTVEMMRDRVRCDLDYVQNWSVLLDLKILFATLGHVLMTDRAV